MKKLLFIAIAFAALALAGCEQERFGEGVQDGVLTTVTAGREAGPATRSALNEEGENLWSVGDKILVAWAGQKPNVFTSKEKEPSETAKFQGLMSVNNSGDDTKYAIYPAEDGNLVNKDGSYALKFHAEQQGQAGTYDPDAFLAVAQSSESNLPFYNVLGLLRITFSEADCDVKSVTLHPWASSDEDGEVEEEDPDDAFDTDEYDGEDDDEDDIAPLIEPAVLVIIPGGVYTVEGGTAPEIVEWTEDLDAIVLNAPEGETFSPEAEYYMAVPPCEFTVGVTFELEHSDGTITKVSIDNTVEVERSKIHDVFLESNPYVPVESVSFPEDEITVNESETLTLEPEILPENATDKTLEWTVDDESVATVEDGVVTAVAPGTVTVTATSVDGPEASVVITVLAPDDPDDPDDPDSDNRISYDGGKTWKPLKQAAFYYSANYQGYEIIVLGDETAPYQTLTEAPSCDWFFLDIHESKLGTHQLPKDLSVFGEWFSYFSWKGAPKGSDWCGAISANEVESGSLELDIDRDKDRIDLEFEAEFEGKSVIVVYHGSAIDSDKDFYHWEWKVPDNRISYDGGESWSELKSAGFYYNSMYDGYEFCFVSEEIDDFSEIMSEPEGGWLLFDIGGEKLGTQDLPDYLATSDWTCFFYWPGKRADDVAFDNGGGLSIDIDVDNMTVDFSMDAEFEGDHVIAVYSGTVIESSRKILREEAWGVGY